MWIYTVHSHLSCLKICTSYVSNKGLCNTVADDIAKGGLLQKAIFLGNSNLIKKALIGIIPFDWHKMALQLLTCWDLQQVGMSSPQQ